MYHSKYHNILHYPLKIIRTLVRHRGICDWDSIQTIGFALWRFLFKGNRQVKLFTVSFQLELEILHMFYFQWLELGHQGTMGF